MRHVRRESDLTHEMFLDRAWKETRAKVHGEPMHKVHTDLATKYLGCQYEVHEDEKKLSMRS